MEQFLPDIGGLISETTATVNAATGADFHPEQVVETVVATGFDWALSLAFAVLVLSGGWLAATWFSNFVYRNLKRSKVEETYSNFLGSIAKYVVIVIAILWALTFFGLTSTSMLAIFGAAGLAIALSLKDFLTHIAAGVMLMVTRPFRVGDYIECAGFAGTVRRITLFNTEINSLYNQRVFMPNGTVWSNPIVNHSYNNTRQAEVRVMVAFEPDPQEVGAVITAALAKNDLVLPQPAPFIGIDTFGDRGVVYMVRCWCRKDNYTAVRYGILKDVRKALEQAGMPIPHAGGVDFVKPKDGQDVIVEVPAKAAKGKGKKTINKKKGK